MKRLLGVEAVNTDKNARLTAWDGRRSSPSSRVVNGVPRFVTTRASHHRRVRRAHLVPARHRRDRSRRTHHDAMCTKRSHLFTNRSNSA